MKFYKENKNNNYYLYKLEKNKLTAIYCLNLYNINFFKNGEYHNTKNAAYNGHDGYNQFYLNGKIYGYHNDFTKESWRKFVKMQVFL